MSILQVKNVSPALAENIRRLAKHDGRTLSDVIVRALEREVQRYEFSAQLKRRKPVSPQKSAVELLSEARRERGER